MGKIEPGIERRHRGSFILKIDEEVQGELFVFQSKRDLMDKLDQIIDGTTFKVRVFKRDEPHKKAGPSQSN